MSATVHYEVHTRKTTGSPWALLSAADTREQAVETAEAAMRDKRAVAVKVFRETLNPQTMVFDSIVVFSRGVMETRGPHRAPVTAKARPRCSHPPELYQPLGRERIAQAFADWLLRNDVTAFELLHRPDLAERLEASGLEIQHAIQRVSVPDSQATGQSVHQVVRHYQALADETVKRLVISGRRRLFPTLTPETFARVAERLLEEREHRAFRMGGAVAEALKEARGPAARLDALLDLVEAAPDKGRGRSLALGPVEKILSEMLCVRPNLTALLGQTLEQGALLAAVVRLVAPREVALIGKHDPRILALIPTLPAPAQRLGEHLADDLLPTLPRALARMVLTEVAGPRRLDPDPAREIEALRVLATLLAAVSDRLLGRDAVHAAFAERSKALVAADFVAAYVAPCKDVLEEVQALAWLCENVISAGAKRRAAQWLIACIASIRFENGLRRSPDRSSGQSLAALAALQRTIRQCGLGEMDEAEIVRRLGAVGAQVEVEGRIVELLVRSTAEPLRRLSALLRLAAGDTAPLGPAADKARAAALSMLRKVETREALSADPTAAAPLKPLIKAAGLAA